MFFYYPTVYNQKSGTYGSYVIASNDEEALEKIKIRNIGESPDCLLSKRPLELHSKELINAVKLYDQRYYKHCLHAIVFMSFILTSANRIPAPLLLQDEGIIHELVHLITNCVTVPSVRIRNLIVEVQQAYDEITHHEVGTYEDPRHFNQAKLVPYHLDRE